MPRSWHALQPACALSRRFVTARNAGVWCRDRIVPPCGGAFSFRRPEQIRARSVDDAAARRPERHQPPIPSTTLVGLPPTRCRRAVPMRQTRPASAGPSFVCRGRVVLITGAHPPGRRHGPDAHAKSLRFSITLPRLAPGGLAFGASLTPLDWTKVQLPPPDAFYRMVLRVVRAARWGFRHPQPRVAAPPFPATRQRVASRNRRLGSAQAGRALIADPPLAPWRVTLPCAGAVHASSLYARRPS
jgi:hypothetical protein